MGVQLKKDNIHLVKPGTKITCHTPPPAFPGESSFMKKGNTYTVKMVVPDKSDAGNHRVQVNGSPTYWKISRFTMGAALPRNYKGNPDGRRTLNTRISKDTKTGN